jgi:ceramide glucosyltransferase
MAFYIFLSLVSLSVLIVLLISVLAAVYARGGKPDLSAAEKFPKVSILKPVKFMDDGMARNIESFYQLDYPDYEIIFCFDGFNEEIHKLIEKFKAKHPKVVTKIVQAGFEKKMNPKIQMLEVMVKEAVGELYWVSDSNIRVEKETLKMLAHEYVTKGSKIVFSPIRGTGSRTIGSIIENSYLNFFVSGSIISAWKIAGRQIIVGKSMLIEKATLEAMGGFASFREYLAEDYIMGLTYTGKGIHISTNFTWAINFNSHSTISTFFSRMTRWAKLRFHIDRFFYIMELLVNPIALALLSTLFIGGDGVKLVIFAAAVKIAAEYLVLVTVNWKDARRLWIFAAYPFCVVLKDILMLFIYLAPFFSSTVNWRGWKIRIGDKSRIIA